MIQKRIFSILILSCCSSLVSAQLINVDFTAQLDGGNVPMLTEIAGSPYNWGNPINGSYAYDDAVSVYSRGLFNYVTPINTFKINFPIATYSFDLNDVNVNDPSLYSYGTYMGAYFYRNPGLNLFAPLSLNSYNSLSGYTPPLNWMVAFQPDGSGFTAGNSFVWYSNYQQTVQAVSMPPSIIFFISALLFMLLLMRNGRISDSTFSQITV
ncbi:hypothetical protein [Methylobacter sp.]|uniref:hypothetical protein n=1 Tax=Methylobacter sp. TaxID=2051955 RepID=UPI001210FD81|nr:hypothetical protein [Methylobacter sp.]TAK61233.1 MAG: hypothetical protein EPO18_14760 [Methylobacter sp.]